ncbi:MAG TPA: hypothetical protein VI423_11135 [Paenisporosarcina sp.]|nr:hypothetical protein [Paenisporosarcina sp.]
MFERWNDPESIEWAKKIKERDNYTCQICRRYGVPLNSHHLNSWDFFVEERYVLANGITLCTCCHSDFHFVYGRGKNTKYQFAEYKRSVDVFRKAILKIV